LQDFIMPRPVVDANDPRNRALGSHPPDEPPLYHGLDEAPKQEEESYQQQEKVPTRTKWTDIDWSSKLLRNHPFRSSIPNTPRTSMHNSPNCEEDEHPDQVETVSSNLNAEEIAKYQRNLFDGSPNQQSQGPFGSWSESPAPTELSHREQSNRQGYWGKRFNRRIKDSKGPKSPEDKIAGLSLEGVNFKVS
jgi:hypothetical protein